MYGGSGGGWDALLSDGWGHDVTINFFFSSPSPSLSFSCFDPTVIIYTYSITTHYMSVCVCVYTMTTSCWTDGRATKQKKSFTFSLLGAMQR